MRLPRIPGFDQIALEKYFKNTGMMLAGKVGSLLITMLVNIRIANYLQPANNGVLNGAITYVYFFSAITALGLDQFIVKELHQNPDNRDRILGTSFFLKLAAGLVAIPLIFACYHLFPARGTPYLFVFILSFTGVIQAFNIIDPFFQSEVQSKYIMQVQIAANLVSAAIKLTLVYLHSPLLWFIYAFLFDAILLSAGYYVNYQRKQRSVSYWRFNTALSRKLLSHSWPLIISGIMVSVYMRIDQIMLLDMRGEAEAGAYATVVRLSEAWYFIPAAIVTTLFPAILNARRDDRERYKKRLQNLYDLMVYLSLPAAVVISFAAPLIYKMLFRPEYAYAAPTFAVHIWSGIFVFLGVVSGQQLIAENYARLSFIRTGFGAVVNIALNLILIPKMGIMGTAIATLIAYAGSAFFVALIPKTSSQGVMMLRSLFLISLFQKLVKR